MEAGTEGDRINPWGVSMFRTLKQVEPNGPARKRPSRSGSTRPPIARGAPGRIHAAQGVIPTPLWIVLFLTAGVIGVFMLFFADSGERAKTQALLIGSVVSVVVAMLLLLSFLDNPYYGGRRRARTGRDEADARASSTRERGHRRLERAASVQRERRPALSERPHREYAEIVATVLLSLAAVATAWSGYQATRWNGEQAKASSRTNAIRVEAARAQGLAEAQTQVDVATFIQWVDAYALKRTSCPTSTSSASARSSGPPSTAWLATKPLENPDAPLTPFAMPQYRLAATAEAERLDAEAEVSSATVRRNIQRSSNYVLGVVLFSVALFFAGTSTRLGHVRLRTISLTLGCIVFLGTLLWIATSPVSVAI